MFNDFDIFEYDPDNYPEPKKEYCIQKFSRSSADKI